MSLLQIPLIKKYQRPIIKLYGLMALVDTGAVVPMLSLASELVEEKFHAEKILEKHMIGGIGGESYGDVYRLKDFKIGEINFSIFDAFVPYEVSLKYPILLSAPLFYGMTYGFDTVDGLFFVDTKDVSLNREFKLYELRGQLYPQIDGVLIQDTSLFLSNMPFGLWV